MKIVNKHRAMRTLSDVAVRRLPCAVCGLAMLVATVPGMAAQPVRPQSSAQASGAVIHVSAAGRWVYSLDATTPGKGCMVEFLSSRNDGTSLSVIGPTAKVATGGILFSSPRIPDASSPTPTQVEMRFDGQPPIRTSALHGPAERALGSVLVPVRDIRQTVGSMTDAEKSVGLQLNGAAVFAMGYDGGHVARDAMMRCLAGDTSAPKAVAGGDIGAMMGHSRISGQVSLKRALLVGREYPQKGAVVQLIMVTDELKAYFEKVKASGVAPETLNLPDSIKRLHRITRISDNQGHFAFENLPPGEYMVAITMDYLVEGTTEEATGNQIVTTVDGHVVGVRDETRTVRVAADRSTALEQTVVIAHDGDAVVVELKKSKMMIFNAFH